MFVGFICGALLPGKKAIGDPWAWDAIQSTLEAFRDELFQPGVLFHNRVTLFRHKIWIWWAWPRRHKCWPWGFAISGRRCWPLVWLTLVPAARSSHVTQKSSALFLCPTDNPDDAEGIAGQAYVQKATIAVSGLPNLANHPTAEDIKAYAEKGYITESMASDRIHQGRILARSFAAFPIEKKGIPWGVVVLDSRDEYGIKDKQSAHYRTIAGVLKKLVERA